MKNISLSIIIIAAINSTISVHAVYDNAATNAPLIPPSQLAIPQEQLTIRRLTTICLHCRRHAERPVDKDTNDTKQEIIDLYKKYKQLSKEQSELSQNISTRPSSKL